ncbi:thioredoxin family protein [Taibaiella chishuiensis]|uniref:Thioredoxin-like protein n=1 Tax=Taibaiella chishuiensis TaxID=1434707 RepID=A0A2P8D9F6_9BACT|nr:thioredoxin family protein [Taibaiella chishuiensis]PSK93855.1 thioredoxin-like protein [Taibaiella chishuiensis]
MKQLLIAVMVLLACRAGAQPLTIIEQDYELAQHTARQQQKLLIVDFYTTWCVPCKVLDKTVFRNDSMAAEIGKHFVVLRYDAEKDSVFNLSLKHHICSYPTTVILTADGRLIHKMFGTGSRGPLTDNYRQLLRESRTLHSRGQYIEGFSGPIDPAVYPAFYKKFVRRTADIRPGDLEQYWAGNKDLMSEVSVAVLAYFGDAPERVRDYFLQHKPEYEARYGKPDAQFILDRMVSDRFHAAIKAKDEAAYAAAVQFAKEYLSPAQVAECEDSYSLELYMARGDWAKATDLVGDRIRRKTISDNSLNYFCWKVYEQCSDKQATGRATLLIRDVAGRNPSFAVLDTYARLLFKHGHTAEAKATMLQAIAMGKANGEDTQESEEALARF